MKRPLILDKKIHAVKTADEARQIAIDWQQWISEQDSSYADMAEWQWYFETLAIKFPELKEEFKENAII